MAKYIGALPTAIDWNEKNALIQNLFGSYFSGLSTHDGNDKYNLPGNSRKVRIFNGSSQIWASLQKLDGTADLGGVSSYGLFSDSQPYLIVKNPNSGAFFLNNQLFFIWSKAGDTLLGCYKNVPYRVSGGDGKLDPVSANTASTWGGYTKALDNGELIFLPAFWPTDINTAFYSGALSDIYVVSHGITAGTAFYVGEREFIALSASLAIENAA